jgi:two-component system, LytTR family, response regulator
VARHEFSPFQEYRSRDGEHPLRSSPEIVGVGASACVLQHSRPVRVLISEPDTVSRRLMCSLLECKSGMTVTCVDDSRIVSAIQESVPDLVIVDSRTPAIRHTESWNTLGIKSAPVTIVTAYDVSSRSVFASNAIDFVLKPFNAERFEDALDLATSEIARVWAGCGFGEKNGREQVQFLRRVAVEADEKIVLLKVEDIRWMQSSGNYIRLHVAKASYLIRESMKTLQVLLDPNHFLRVHRNAIVNLDHVEEFHLPITGNMFVKLDDGLCLPLRKASRLLLRKLLKKHFIA